MPAKSFKTTRLTQNTRPFPKGVLGQGVRRHGVGLRVGIYARIWTQDQHTLPMQVRAPKQHARHRGWQVVTTIRDVGSGVSERPQRKALVKMARRREIDAVLVWRLDRWGRSLSDVV